MFNENDLLEKKILREKMIGRVEVLDKVGELLLLPITEFATTEQVAKYYEVEEVVIRQVVARNNDELTSDGLATLRGNDIKDFYDTRDKSSQVSVVPERGGILINGVKVAYSPNLLFPKRAILRVGMLLRDSEVAKEVRTKFLDVIYEAETKRR